MFVFVMTVIKSQLIDVFEVDSGNKVSLLLNFRMYP